MPGSARARSLRLPSAPPSRCSKACRSTSAELPRGSSGASGPASASARSSKAARCSTAARATVRCRRCFARVPFPRDWRVLLIFDPAETGVHGANEIEAFADAAGLPRSGNRRSHPAYPARCAAGACRPGLQDLLRRGRLSAERRWAPISRRYRADPMSARASQRCSRGSRSDGVTGLGQSSWGPTGFAFAASEAEGEALLAAARNYAGGARLQIRAGARPKRARHHRGR